MVALSADRNTALKQGDLRSGLVGAATKIFKGSIVMRNAAGYLIKGATATGSFGVGIAQSLADNTLGANGALSVNWRPGVAYLANLVADPCLVTDIGAKCWIVDDQTVAKTNGTATITSGVATCNTDTTGTGTMASNTVSGTLASVAGGETKTVVFQATIN
mgnify:CR=1 FL=1